LFLTKRQVEEAFCVPLSFFLSPDNTDIEHFPSVRWFVQYYFYWRDPHSPNKVFKVWGMTANIILALLEMVYGYYPYFRYRS
jgi:hypothetical protein